MSTYYERNKERILASRKANYAANKEAYSAKAKEYRKKPSTAVKSAMYKRKWYNDNKERILAKQANKYARNSESVNVRTKKYNKSNGAVKKKLRRHQEEDEEKGREFDLTYQYVIDLLVNQNNECAHCDITVKLAWTKAYDSAQFSINRINNKIGHIEGNVEICCLQCNRTYRSK